MEVLILLLIGLLAVRVLFATVRIAFKAALLLVIVGLFTYGLSSFGLL